LKASTAFFVETTKVVEPGCPWQAAPVDFPSSPQGRICASGDGPGIVNSSIIMPDLFRHPLCRQTTA
jgi:hypothetical protein